jgi:hypothetical protein
MISARAGLKKVPWDGYLKHNRPSPKHTEEKCALYPSLNISVVLERSHQICFGQ